MTEVKVMFKAINFVFFKPIFFPCLNMIQVLLHLTSLNFMF